MQQSVYIYRSASLLLLAIVCFSGAGIGCLLRLYFVSDGAFDAEQASLWAFVTFSVIATMMLVRQFQQVDPIVSLHTDRIVLLNMWQPRHRAEIARECLLHVTTNALSGGERSDLIFTVTGECFAELRKLTIWRTTEANKLYYEFVNAQVSPSRAATMITAWMHDLDME